MTGSEACHGSVLKGLARAGGANNQGAGAFLDAAPEQVVKCGHLAGEFVARGPLPMLSPDEWRRILTVDLARGSA